MSHFCLIFRYLSLGGITINGVIGEDSSTRSQPVTIMNRSTLAQRKQSTRRFNTDLSKNSERDGMGC